MRKFLSITCICILCVSQYARQFNYLECLAANQFSTTAVNCDCETLGKKLAPTSPGPSSPHKQHQHALIDEWYHSDSSTYDPFSPIADGRSQLDFYKAGKIRLPVSDIDHPPSV